MDFSDIHILRLEEDEKVESFDCGDEDLNDFIINEAQPYRKALIATSYIAQNGFAPLNDDDKDDSTRLLYFDLATL